MKFAPSLGGMQQAGVQKSLRTRYFVFFLAVSDYKRFDASLYFIITSVHTELKPQAKISNGMNSPAFTLSQRFINHGQLVNHTAFIRFD